MSKGKDTTLSKGPSELALSAAERKYPPAKSDEAMAFYGSYMPPLEVHLLGGTTLVVVFKDLDERLEELRQTYKERRSAR